MEADKKYLWINGNRVEVTNEVYEAYVKGDRKMRYFESDLKTERIIFDDSGELKRIVPSREDSLDRLVDDKDEQFVDKHENVEDDVLRKLTSERLHKAIIRLTEKEQQLVYDLFFEERTERDIAVSLGISQPAVHKRKNRILKKLKNFLENSDL